MPKADAVRWNLRYFERRQQQMPEPRELLVKFHHLIPPGGLVLDMAMGLGSSACFLDEKGFRVIGMDISAEAVHQVKNHSPSSIALIADSQYISFPPATFDAILNFYYLDRNLFGLYNRILKKSGFLFFETPAEGTDTNEDSFPPEYLLGRNELLQTYPTWDILYRDRVRIQSKTHRLKVIEKIILRKA
jgi:SAM-dependent methyltransferase